MPPPFTGAVMNLASRRGQNAALLLPPPCFAWFPLPRFAAEEPNIANGLRSRDALTHCRDDRVAILLPTALDPGEPSFAHRRQVRIEAGPEKQIVIEKPALRLQEPMDRPIAGE